MTSRARSASNCSAAAEPMPPEPPASTISFPSSVSGVDNILLQCEVSAGDYYEKHRQHFAIAEVQLDDAFRHRGQHDGDAAVQKIAPVARPMWKRTQPTPEIAQDLQQHPHQNDQRRYSPLGRVVKVDVVQMPVPAGGQRTRNIGGDVFVEVNLDALGP